MASYTNSVCTIGSIQFTFGSNPYIYGKDDIDVPASAVTVTPYGSGTANDPTGFIFTASNWTATNPDTSGNHAADINITFNALLMAPPAYKLLRTDLTLGVNIANATGNSYVQAGENVSNNVGGANLGFINLTVAANDNASSLALGGTALSGTSHFQATNVNINKDINLSANDTNTVTVNSVLETFSYAAVPEPGPFVLTGLGLAFLVFFRRRKQALHILGAVALFVFVSGVSHATSLCTNATLQSYIDAGQCEFGGFTFTFTPSSYTASGTGTYPTASGIQVTPSINGRDVALQFTPNSPAPKTVGSQTVSLGFTYTIQGDAWVTAFAAQDTASTGGTGSLAGSAAKLKDSSTTISSVSFPSKSSGGGAGTAFSRVSSGTILTVTDSFSLSSSGTSINNSHLSNFTNTITVTPEPLTSSLCGAGLLALALVFRSRRSRV
jgi:hypothetical protein